MRSTIKFYILDEHGAPVEGGTTEEWARFFENAEGRIVAQSVIGGHSVSTVFVGVGGFGKPVLFETRVFARDQNHRAWGHFEHSDTWDEALQAHDRAVALIERK